MENPGTENASINPGKRSGFTARILANPPVVVGRSAGQSEAFQRREKLVESQTLFIFLNRPKKEQ